MSAQHQLSGRDGRLLIYVVSTVCLFVGVASKLPAWVMVALATWCSTTLANCAFDLSQLSAQNEKAHKAAEETYRRLEETHRRLIKAERERDHVVAELQATTEAKGPTRGLGGLCRIVWRHKHSASSNGQPGSSRPGC